MSESPCLLLGCGILKREVQHLGQKNGWPLDFYFFDSALHTDFEALGLALDSGLARYKQARPIVFYGACHPLMDRILGRAGVERVKGQNCVEMLLGPERFAEELANGAFFLLEEWARRWRDILSRTFGTNVLVMRDIFQADRKYLLAVRTPCSGDFSAEAADAAALVGLPLRWIEVNLDHLERTLQAALDARMASPPCAKPHP